MGPDVDGLGSPRRSCDNIERNGRNLGLERTRTEHAINRIG